MVFKKIFFVYVIVFLECSILCAQPCIVYGKVLDYGTGKRMGTVPIGLVKNGEVESSMRTDDRGEYSFEATKNQVYQLFVKLVDYEVLEDEFVCSVDSMRRDVVMYKPMKILYITEVGNADKEVELLDIGAIRAQTSYYVQFFNAGSESITYHIGSMRKWITEISPLSGAIEPNEMMIVTIKIDPKKFEAGDIVGDILVMTNDGCKILRIKAIGEYPVLTMLPPVKQYGFGDPDTFITKIEFEGQHTFKKLGYCYSYTNQLPTVEDNVVFANDMGTYAYDMLYDLEHSLSWFNSFFDEACRTYYIRSFLVYEKGQDTIIHYSWNVEKFTIMEELCF